MNDRPTAIKHSLIAYPALFWATDYLYCGNDILLPWKLLKSEFHRKNKYWKTMRILDSSGKCFVVDRFEEIPPRNRLTAFFRQRYWSTWAVPIITAEKQLDIHDFKAEIKRAVSAKQQRDIDSNIMAQTMKSLPSATTFAEAIKSLPKII